jgi:hypothetical protein
MKQNNEKSDTTNISRTHPFLLEKDRQADRQNETPRQEDKQTSSSNIHIKREKVLKKERNRQLKKIKPTN